LLKGRTVNLRVMEKEDLPLVAEWLNNPDFYGRCLSPIQRTKAEIEKTLETNPLEYKQFIIEKKDGTKIGGMVHFNVLTPMGKILEIGYALLPNERGKGYCTEAAKIMVDYLFLSKDIACIQATTDVENVGSQRVLEKTGFQREGLMRKRFFINGEWVDTTLFSILREEWKQPKILTTQPSTK
jgi:RimJ/RimL family protein N-acetyltransferase